MQLPLAHHQLEKLGAAFPNQCRVSTIRCPKPSLRKRHRKKAQLPDNTRWKPAYESIKRDSMRLFPAVYVAGSMSSRHEEFVALELCKLQQG